VAEVDRAERHVDEQSGVRALCDVIADEVLRRGEAREQGGPGRAELGTTRRLRITAPQRSKVGGDGVGHTLVEDVPVRSIDAGEEAITCLDRGVR
jgi:hypothetical protein